MTKDMRRKVGCLTLGTSFAKQSKSCTTRYVSTGRSMEEVAETREQTWSSSQVGPPSCFTCSSFKLSRNLWSAYSHRTDTEKREKAEMRSKVGAGDFVTRQQDDDTTASCKREVIRNQHADDMHDRRIVHLRDGLRGERRLSVCHRCTAPNIRVITIFCREPCRVSSKTQDCKTRNRLRK